MEKYQMKLKVGQRFKLQTDSGFEIHAVVIEDNINHRSYWVQDLNGEDDYWNTPNMRYISYDLIERCKDKLTLLDERNIVVSCTCGALSVGHPGHTWYCDLYGKT